MCQIRQDQGLVLCPFQQAIPSKTRYSLVKSQKDGFVGPLKGIRVVEMAGLGAAPMCAMFLADLGAEVFRIERKGDPSDEASMHVKTRDMINRGRHVMAIDLKSDEGLALLRELIGGAHVLLESFRPGVMERNGLGPDICLQRNPALVYARLSGWGQDGPLAQAAGHDPNYVALTGALHHSGSRDVPPQAPATLLGDAAGGAAMTALGICAALIPAIQRGEGEVIDAAIGEGTNYLTTLVRSFYNTGQLTDERGTSWMEGAAHWSRTYRCADDRFITLLPVETRFYQVLLEKLGLSEHGLFTGSHHFDRKRWPEQVAHLEALFQTKTRDEWVELMEGSDACFAPVLTFGEAPEHPHNVARGNFIQVDGDWYPSPAPRFSHSVVEPDWEGEKGAGTARDALLGLGIPADMVDAAI